MSRGAKPSGGGWMMMSTRGSLRVGYVHDLGADRSFDAAVDLAKGVLSGEVQPSVTFGYAVRF